ISLLCTSFLISISAAIPVLQADHSKVYRQPINGNQKNGAIALSKTFRKYGWTIQRDLADELAEHTNAAPSKRADGHGSGVGQVAATLVNQNSEYLCPVNIGGQILNMNIDTGSSDLYVAATSYVVLLADLKIPRWLFSTALSNDERGNHTIYDPSKSASHISVSGATFNVSYGDDTSLTGDVATDTVIIGGVSVAYQALELPTAFSSGIIDDPSDGIVGLGFQKINSICSSGGTPPAGIPHTCPEGYVPNPRPTWFENAKSALQAGIFTVNFKQGTAGYYSFGSIDHRAAKGDIKYTPVDASQGFWQFPSTRYKIGNGETHTYSGKDGIADSGTSLLMLDPEIVSAYYAAVQGAKQDSKGYTFPCSTELPDFTVAMGDYMAIITGDVINYAPTRNGMCYGGIQSNEGHEPQIFGDIMFRSQFVVFDYDNMQLGFAPHA
ncbi:MAG: hypothetical protein Q9217_004898, partial [Psora testacea]